jgi:hypothetical protein
MNAFLPRSPIATALYDAKAAIIKLLDAPCDQTAALNAAIRYYRELLAIARGMSEKLDAEREAENERDAIAMCWRAAIEPRGNDERGRGNDGN